ncbi:MAG: hypothetical protein F4Y02_09380 [Chloroflexi bacterium]|nr:hypothetical protein [Chloroflexota bacterium]
MGNDLRSRLDLAGAGRLLLVGAVVFWWGAFVIPRLVSLVFPEWLSPASIPWHLNPEQEGSVANVLSAVSFLTVGLLGTANAVVGYRAMAGWVAVGGWGVLAVAAALASLNELLDYHNAVFGTLKQLLFEMNHGLVLLIILSSLLVALGLVMVAFIRRGLRTPGVRVLFVFGVVVWLLAAARDVGYEFLFQHRVDVLASLVEETLEFGGALLIGLSAASALGAGEPSPGWTGGLHRRAVTQMASGAALAVAVLGGWVIVFAFQAPVVDTRAYTHVGTFHVSLGDSEAVAQELLMPAVPIARLDLRLGTRDPHGRSGAVVWRIVSGGVDEEGPILRAGRTDVPADEFSRWQRVSFPPLTQAEGQPLTVLVQADVEQGARLLVGGSKTSHDAAGRLWINGEPAWPDQRLTVVAHGASEPTRSKLQAIRGFVTSDWRWPVLFVDLTVSLILIALIPILLLSVMWGGPRVGGIPSGSR